MATAKQRVDDGSGTENTLGYSLHVIGAIGACAYRSVDSGCCVGAQCAIRKNKTVTGTDCLECGKMFGADFMVGSTAAGGK
jgi:hypothetical protein